MTQRKLYTVLAWLLPLLQLLVGTGMAQRAVICIAPGGHLAIEAPHPRAGCGATQRNSRSAPLGLLIEDAVPQTCQDTPIFVAGSHLAALSSVETLLPVSQTISFLSPPTMAAHQGPALPSHITSNARRFPRHVLRSIVLRI